MKFDEIILNIEASSKEAINSAQQLLTKFSSLKKSSDSTTSSMQKFNNIISPISDKLKKLDKDVDNISNNFTNKLYKALHLKPTIDTTGFEAGEKALENQANDIRKEIASLEKEYESYNTKVKVFGETYQKYIDKQGNISSKAVQGYAKEDLGTSNYNEAIAKASEYETKIGELKTTLQSVNDQRVAPDLSDVITNADEARQAFIILNEEKERAIGTAKYGEIDNALKKITKQYGISAKSVLGLNNNLKKTSSSASGLNKIKKSASKISSAFDGIKNKVGKVSSAFSSFGKKAGNALGSLTKKMKKVTLGLLAVRTAMSLLTRSVNAYLSFDSALQDSVSNSWNMLGALLGPAIERVANLFAYATTYVYSFVKALTGIDLVARANAKALQTQASATGSAAKEASKSLAAFDELNNLNQDTSAGGSGSDLNLIEVPDIEANSIFDSVMAALKNGQWYEAGEIIANGINDALDSIPWTSIQKKAESLGTNVAKFLNGGIENLNWELLGTTIGNAIQTAIDYAYGFAMEFNFKKFGEGLADELNGVFKAIKWDKLAKTLGYGFKGVIDSIGSFLGEVNWKAIGEDVREFLVNIPWGEIWESVKTAIGNAFTGFSDFMSGLFKIDSSVLDKITGAIVGLVAGIGVVKLLWPLIKKLSKAKDTVKETTDVMSEGISNLATSFGKSLESLGKAAEVIAILGGLALVIQSLTELFKTFSDSNMSLSDAAGLVAIAIGGVVVGFGLMAAATNLMDWEGIAGAAVILVGMALVLQTLVNVLNAVAKTGSSVNDVSNLMLTIFGGLAVTMALVALLGPSMTAGLVPFAAVVGIISALLIVMSLTLPTILDAAASFIQSTAPYLIALLNTIGNIITNIIYALGTSLPPIIRSVGSLFTTIFNGVSKIIKTVGDTIVNILNTAKSLVTTVLSAILNFINQLGPAINNFVDNAITAVTKLINFMVSGVEYLINTVVVTGINSLIKKVNKIPLVNFSLMSDVSIPRFVPKLATGTNEIPQEGIYHLHEGEAVVPKKYNPAVGGGYDGNDKAVEETNDLLRSLIDVVNSKNYEPKIGVEDIGKASVNYIRKQRRVTGGSVI